MIRIPNTAIARFLYIFSLFASLAGTAPADADCAGPHGSEPVEMVPSDLAYLLGLIDAYQQDPTQLYGPGPWTNWYLEEDDRAALAKLAMGRAIFDQANQWNIYREWIPEAGPMPERATGARLANGTWNNLEVPAMGSAGTRFTRIVYPFSPDAQPDFDALMAPNPRTVSRALLSRDEFKPAGVINLMAAAWIQFQIHDWFNHTNQTDGFHEVPLAEDDPLASPAEAPLRGYPMAPSDAAKKNNAANEPAVMRVARTAADPTRRESEAGLAPTYLNEVTHWWDASQLYGSDQETAERLRSFEGGRLQTDANGRIPVAGDGFEDTGMRQNWWLGLGLMHDLFVKEHNAVAAMLAEAYPDWPDQKLYDTSRLIVSALIARIHTLEWTPAILPNPRLEAGMNSNWNGLNQYFSPPFSAPPPGLPELFEPVLFGVVGGNTDLKTDPISGLPVHYQFPEEFASVYRMHPLLPDSLEVQPLPEESVPGENAVITLSAMRDASGRQIQEDLGEATLLNTFGVADAGALTLNNYPTTLQDIQIPFSGRLDLGAVDILRDRERGVARYNDFRRQMQLPPVPSIDALVDDPGTAQALKEIYGFDDGAIDRVDLFIGTLAESYRPACYGFGETLFTLFTGLATRRLQADRFYTVDYRPEIYTPEGIEWVENNSMKSVLLRHYPELADSNLAYVTNAFFPWDQAVDPDTGPSFENWISRFVVAGVSATSMAPLDDPDRDGVPNIFEYLAANHPFGPNERRLMEISRESETGVVTAVLHLRSDDPRFATILQLSSDLDLWEDVNLSPDGAGAWEIGNGAQVSLVDAQPVTENLWRVELRYDGGVTPQLMRLRIDQVQ